MDWQLAIIIAATTLAVGFVGWRVIGTFRRKDCGDCCGHKPS